MIKLIFTLPDGNLLTHEVVEPRLVIGSGVDCQVVVPSETVAENHVELLQDESGYLVADLAGNGTTFLNGHPIEPGSYYQLETGTQIQMGTVEAVYIASEAVASVQPVAEAEEEVFEETASVARTMRPGAYPLPSHPPGMFVPLKPERSIWAMVSFVVTAVAVIAAAYAGYMGTTVTLP